MYIITCAVSNDRSRQVRSPSHHSASSLIANAHRAAVFVRSAPPDVRRARPHESPFPLSVRARRRRICICIRGALSWQGRGAEYVHTKVAFWSGNFRESRERSR